MSSSSLDMGCSLSHLLVAPQLPAVPEPGHLKAHVVGQTLLLQLEGGRADAGGGRAACLEERDLGLRNRADEGEGGLGPRRARSRRELPAASNRSDARPSSLLPGSLAPRT